MAQPRYVLARNFKKKIKYWGSNQTLTGVTSQLLTPDLDIKLRARLGDELMYQATGLWLNTSSGQGVLTPYTYVGSSQVAGFGDVSGTFSLPTGTYVPFSATMWHTVTNADIGSGGIVTIRLYYHVVQNSAVLNDGIQVVAMNCGPPDDEDE